MKIVESAKVIAIVETKSKKGDGTGESPYRTITRYWTLDGKLISEKEEVGGEYKIELTPNQFSGQLDDLSPNFYRQG